ncbi:MAG TPA: FAD-binding protein, partial [candidate division Zixibacteria bacterium]|nr:FAD-binding protein [candidate division Zixibacteria bacterium]
RESIPVAPSAHYLCGGVRATLDGLTDLRGLLACGETTHTGMHGANRLASNSLLEAVVMAEFAAGWTLANERDFGPIEPQELPDWVHSRPRRREKIFLAHERAELKRLMSDYLGIVRSLDRLKIAHKRLTLIEETVRREFAEIPDIYGALELRNLAQVALLMTEMAMARHESRGLHYLLDYPETDDIHWKHDSIIRPAVDGARVVEHV